MIIAGGLNDPDNNGRTPKHSRTGFGAAGGEIIFNNRSIDLARHGKFKALCGTGLAAAGKPSSRKQ